MRAFEHRVKTDDNTSQKAYSFVSTLSAKQPRYIQVSNALLEARHVNYFEGGHQHNIGRDTQQNTTVLSKSSERERRARGQNETPEDTYGCCLYAICF